MLTKEGTNLPLTEITAANYVVEENDKDFYHCKLERKLFSSTDGSRISRPFVQMFDVKGFEMLYRNLVEQGYSVEILHDPTAKVEEVKDEPKTRKTRKEE